MARWITVNGTDIDTTELWSLHQLARVPLGSDASWLDRANWACREYAKAHPDCPPIRAYKALHQTRNY